MSWGPRIACRIGLALSREAEGDVLSLRTKRLVLVAGTSAIGQADLRGHEELGEILGASVPADWPPPLNDENSTRWFVEQVEAAPQAVGWFAWYFLLQGPGGNLRAIGLGGFKGAPDESGMVEIGYSIMEDDQRAGFATECVAALLEWAFADESVSRVTAQTLPSLTASIRVLEKSGFAFIGQTEEPGVIQYELKRPSKG